MGDFEGQVTDHVRSGEGVSGDAQVTWEQVI